MAVNKKEISPWPFYWNYNFTISISAHEQTYNEYLITKYIFEYGK